MGWMNPDVARATSRTAWARLLDPAEAAATPSGAAARRERLHY